MKSNHECMLAAAYKHIWFSAKCVSCPDPHQAVALVFQHVTTAGPARTPRAAAEGGSPLSPRHSGLLAEHGPANAALKLLDDLCMMVTGAPSGQSCRQNCL